MANVFSSITFIFPNMPKYLFVSNIVVKVHGLEGY